MMLITFCKHPSNICKQKEMKKLNIWSKYANKLQDKKKSHQID